MCNKLHLCVLEKANRKSFLQIALLYKNNTGPFLSATFLFSQKDTVLHLIQNHSLCQWFASLLLPPLFVLHPLQNLLEHSMTELRWPSTLKTLISGIKYITYLYHDTWGKHSMKGQVAFCYLGMCMRCVCVHDWCICRARKEFHVLLFTQHQMQAARKRHKNLCIFL